MVQAYDTASESIEALNAAELKFNDIINSPTLDAACKKIDTLAEKKELDSALMLMLTKAWSASKESNMMKDEVFFSFLFFCFFNDDSYSLPKALSFHYIFCRSSTVGAIVDT